MRAALLCAMLIALCEPAFAGLTPYVGTHFERRATPRKFQLPIIRGLVCRNASDVRNYVVMQIWRRDLSGSDARALRLRATNTLAHDPAACSARDVQYFGPWEFVDRIVRPYATYLVYRVTIESDTVKGQHYGPGEFRYFYVRGE